MFSYKERQCWRERGFTAARTPRRSDVITEFDAYRDEISDMMEVEYFTAADWAEAEYYWCYGWAAALDGEESA